MLSCKFAQLVVRTPRTCFGVLPSQYGRTLTGAKKSETQAKSDPKGKENTGTKMHPASAKSDAAGAQSTVGSTGPGAVGKDNRGKEDTLKGAAAKHQAPTTNYQQKRSLHLGWPMLAQDSRKQTTPSGGKKGDSESFVSDQAKKNLDPEPSREKGTVEMLDFYPEKPGSRLEQMLGVDKQQKQNDPHQSVGSSAEGKGDHYDSKQHNPSRTGQEQDDKYLDEALSGKSGPLVGTEKGKRRFSTSAAVFTVTPSGKGNQSSGMGAGHDAVINDGASSPKPPIDTPQPKSGGNPLPDKLQGGRLKGTERERTGDDRRDANKGQKGFSTDMGTIDGAERKQTARRLHTAAPLSEARSAQDEERQKQQQRKMLSSQLGRSGDDNVVGKSELSGGDVNEDTVTGSDNEIDAGKPPRGRVAMNPLDNVNASSKPRNANPQSLGDTVPKSPRRP